MLTVEVVISFTNHFVIRYLGSDSAIGVKKHAYPVYRIRGILAKRQTNRKIKVFYIRGSFGVDHILTLGGGAVLAIIVILQLVMIAILLNINGKLKPRDYIAEALERDRKAREERERKQRMEQFASENELQ